MSAQSIKSLRPFLSILIFICTLFTMAFFKMEVRRLGYSLLRVSRVEKAAKDQQRLQNIAFYRLTQPGRIENLAQTRLALSKASEGQLVHVAGKLLIVSK
jgi:hypothetical protein